MLNCLSTYLYLMCDEIVQVLLLVVSLFRDIIYSVIMAELIIIIREKGPILFNPFGQSFRLNSSYTLFLISFVYLGLPEVSGIQFSSTCGFLRALSSLSGYWSRSQAPQVI